MPVPKAAKTLAKSAGTPGNVPRGPIPDLDLAPPTEALLLKWARSLDAAHPGHKGQGKWLPSLDEIPESFLDRISKIGASVSVSPSGLFLRTVDMHLEPVQVSIGPDGISFAEDRGLFTVEDDFVFLSPSETERDAKDGDDTVILLAGGASGPVFGNSGNDTVLGNAADDSLFGDSGEDLLVGGSGADKLSGGDDADTLQGGDGADLLKGGKDNDLLDGGAGEDRLYGDTGDDSLYGGDDVDMIYGGNGNDLIDGGDGSDNLFGGKDNDTLIGSAGNDLLEGQSGNDSMSGGDGDDTLIGTSGDDTLIGGFGADSLSGGSGTDWFVFDAETSDGSSDTIIDLNADDIIVLAGFDELLAAADPLLMLADAFIVQPSGDGLLQFGDLHISIENSKMLDEASFEELVISAIQIA
ncbi:Hemolysin-type calcium-binding repeat-containing protein [Mameliella alba]|uniref:calcium-binding protein n=1 Tax=Mameliella alba TaxID=561184 RepID=UPI000890157A|nr:calcium-binding protein [Mameliella alba]PTR39896.1 hemolysin type calcium-binding protein [Mameliella alba]GGF60644.1 hypothetical protein GCM10011319_22160 [Mameliella alba]SDD09353.1 Hemolysin-type calcium-binding repeat-containing protein [Mameliella alba]